MIGTLIGRVQMFANMTDPPSRPVHGDRAAATLYGAVVANLSACRSPTSCTSSWSRKEVNRTLIIDGTPTIRDSEEPDAGARG